MIEEIAAFIALANLTINTAKAANAAVEKLKPLVDQMFNSGLITAEQQAKLHAWIEAEKGRVRAGEYPEHMQVQPDPGA